MSKQVADQNEEIKTLKRDLLDTKSRELKNLQYQISNQDCRRGAFNGGRGK